MDWSWIGQRATSTALRFSAFDGVLCGVTVTGTQMTSGRHVGHPGGGVTGGGTGVSVGGAGAEHSA